MCRKSYRRSQKLSAWVEVADNLPVYHYENKLINISKVSPPKTEFYYIKVEFKVVRII